MLRSLLYIAALVTVLVLHELAEIVVGELGLGGGHHLVVKLVRKRLSSRHEPEVLHVVLVAGVDQRVVLIVCVDDLIVGRLVVLLEEEFDEALALTESRSVLGAHGVASDTESWDEVPATLARVVDLEGALLSVVVRVGGL